MKDLDFDPKRKAILESAYAAFSTYGFRKTSMDDIAKGAQMSRPAVYLHYKNKEAIFRCLVELYYVGAATDVQAVLNGEGDVPGILSRAFVAQGSDTAETMMSSPHGMELLDAGTSVACEEVSAGEASLRAIYAEWLGREAEAGKLNLGGQTPEAVAAAFCAALKGVKMTAPDFPTYSATIQVLAQLFGTGLSRR